MENNLLKLIYDAVEEKKAIQPIILDLRGISGVTDYFVICSGNSAVQVKAIADNINERLAENSQPIGAKEGYAEGRWILMDFGDIVVHVLNSEEREFYALEKLWHDGKTVEI